MSKRTSALRLRAGWVIFHAVRAVESLGGPALLRAFAWPAAAICATADLPQWCALPPRSAIRASSLGAFWRARLRCHLTRVLCFMPDRLITERWLRRCRIEGEEHLLSALRSGQPVVLPTLHFGAVLLLRYWLRAKGHPVAALVTEPVSRRHALKQHKDSLSPPANVPNVISGTQPRDALRFLKQGGALMVILDNPYGRQIEARVRNSPWRVSGTAFRLASLTGAVMLPTLIYEEAPWRFVVHVGRPAPDLGRPAADFEDAARHIWNELEPILRKYPDDCLGELRESLRQICASRPANPLTCHARV